MPRSSWVAMVVLVGFGCVLDEVALEGRPCPCAPGWTCDERNLCVRGDAQDAGTVDAGPQDAGPLDAGFDASPDATVVDATVVDATLLDAPLSDASDAGDAATPIVIFEEDFETGDYARWSYLNEEGGTLALGDDATTAHGGAGFLRATTTTAGGAAALGVMSMGTFDSGDLWLRLYVRAPSTASYIPGAAFAAFGMGMEPWDSVSIQAEETAVSTYVSTEPRYVNGTRALTRDAWSCVLGHLVIGNGTEGSLEVFVDGRTSLRTVALDTLPVVGWSVLEVGLTYTGPEQGPTTILIDDITLARTPLSCD